MHPLQLDVHTHTLASGHAYGTITEMARAAADKGLSLLGITEHASGIPGTCADLYFANLPVVPRQMFGIDLLLGAEINILDHAGTLSMAPKLIDTLDLRIAGIHEQCYTFGTIEENTHAVLQAIRNPAIDIISHPDDGNCPLDYDILVLEAKRHHTLLEINNNALRHPETRKNVVKNALTILETSKRHGAPVLLSSDAHYMTDIANIDHIAPLLARTDFPDELVINYSAERFSAWLKENRARGKRV